MPDDKPSSGLEYRKNLLLKMVGFCMAVCFGGLILGGIIRVVRSPNIQEVDKPPKVKMERIYRIVSELGTWEAKSISHQSCYVQILDDGEFDNFHIHGTFTVQKFYREVE